MDSSLLRINLLDCFDSLLEHLQAFGKSLAADRRLPIWVSRSEQEIEQGLDMRPKAVRLFQSLWYEDGQDGRETITCPGLIGASTGTLQAAIDCNTAKNAFRDAVLALKKLRKPEADALLDELHRRDPDVALAMRRMGTARLNLKQAYRHIPLLDARPVKVGFTWSRQGRTIQRIDHGRVRTLLERRSETAQTRLELDKLSRLPPDEPLARVRPVCPHLRANVVFDVGGDTERRLVQTPLPLLVPLQAGEDLPEFVPVPPHPVGTDRLRRSDVRLEDEPFLVSLRVYRYRERYREKR